MDYSARKLQIPHRLPDFDQNLLVIDFIKKLLLTLMVVYLFALLLDFEELIDNRLTNQDD